MNDAPSWVAPAAKIAVGVVLAVALPVAINAALVSIIRPRMPDRE